MGRIFVCSDTHFGHKNIIEYCNRPFKDTDEMDAKLIENWNSVVEPEDTVFFLGDFALGGKQDIINYGQALNGHKILVLGNHDHSTKVAYREAGFENIFGEKVIIDFDDYGTIQFSHHRVPDEETHYINLYGHQHDKPTDDSMHRCVSMECINYKPILLEEAIKGLGE